VERAKSPVQRCAVYTRKSSEEGLEQDFNSLQAQREACEAFIKSQSGEGWRLVKTAYDDGGISGGMSWQSADSTLSLWSRTRRQSCERQPRARISNLFRTHRPR
jgi:site-specific DNA recombinase